jgi:hypothetical protein
MKKERTDSLRKNGVKFILTAAILVALGSCAKKISFAGSSVVPAARGFVKVKKDNNSNYNIKVELSNLAEVSRLQPPRQTYVVWMETDQQTTKNIGQIQSSSSMLSKKLKANLETVSSFKPVKIFITAEDDAAVQYPGTQMVLSTSSF